METTEAATISRILADKPPALNAPQPAAEHAASHSGADLADYAQFKDRWDLYGKLPLNLSVCFPLQQIIFSNLANLKPGMLLHSAWPVAEDVPMLTGEVFLANVSFEPVGTRLGVRLSGFVARPIPAAKRPSGTSGAEESSATNLLNDLRLSLTVCVGTAQVLLQEILQWVTGDTIPLDRPVNAPVNILLKERIVASGNLVLVGGFYAVQLTSIAQRSKRLPIV